MLIAEAQPCLFLPLPLCLSAQTEGGGSTDALCRLAGVMPNPHDPRRTRKFRLKDGRLRLHRLVPEDRAKIEALLDEMERVSKEANGHQWKLGDLCVQFEALGMSLDVAAERLKKFGYARSTLGQYRQVAETYPNAADRKGLSWFRAFEAMRAWKTASDELKRQHTPVSLARLAIEKNISARKLRAMLAKKQKKQNQRTNSAVARRMLAQYPILKRQTFNASCIEVIPKLPDGAVRLAWFDPPYADYERTEDGVLSLEASMSAEIDTVCDNLSREEAEALMRGVFQTALPKMAPGGALILWQRGGKADNWRILQVADDAGWVCKFAGLWDKGVPQPGSFDEPFSVSTERFLVFYRQGDKASDCQDGGNQRQEVLDDERLDRIQIPAETRVFRRKLRSGEANIGYVHAYEKPAKLNNLFVRKFTYEDDLIVDLCGCTGSMAVAAHQLKRRWMYVESNAETYRKGIARIGQVLELSAAESAA